MCTKKANGEVEAKERGKNITFWGGMALIINNLTGPGLVVLGAAYQGGGWVMASFVTIVIGILSVIGCGMIAQAMAHVRGNEHFQGSIEYTNLCKAIFPRWLYYCTMIAFLLFFQFSNISQIVESAQVFDFFLLNAFNKTCALEFSPIVSFECIPYDSSASVADSPFGNSEIVLSLGMVLTFAISLPLGYVNLDDNIWFQFLAAVVMIVIWLEWSGQSIVDGQNFTKVHAFVSNQYQVFGNILFNYAVVVSIPSWINEKKPEASINWTIWLCGVATIFMYLTLGWLSADDVTLDYQATTGADNVDILSLFTKAATPILTKVMVYLFIITLISGIPVWAIIIRYNLVQDEICSESVANIFAVILPFIVSIFFYSGSLLGEIVNIVGFLLCVPLNFVIPGFLYIMVLRRPSKPFTILPDTSKYVSMPGVIDEEANLSAKGNASDRTPSNSSSNDLTLSLMPDEDSKADADNDSISSYEHGGQLELLPPTYHVLPIAWSRQTKEIVAHCVIWIPLAMCVPAIVLWILITFCGYTP